MSRTHPVAIWSSQAWEGCSAHCTLNATFEPVIPTFGSVLEHTHTQTRTDAHTHAHTSQPSPSDSSFPPGGHVQVLCTCIPQTACHRDLPPGEGQHSCSHQNLGVATRCQTLGTHQCRRDFQEQHVTIEVLTELRTQGPGSFCTRWGGFWQGPDATLEPGAQQPTSGAKKAPPTAGR